MVNMTGIEPGKDGGKTMAIEDNIAAHERYVRGQPGGARLFCRMMDLQGLVAQKRVLDEAHFVGCDLSGARLALSRLTRATFYVSSLQNADLRGCDLDGADLRGTGLRGAKLYAARLNGADLRAAELVVVDKQNPFRRIDRYSDDAVAPEGPRSVDFSGASMKNIKLAGAKLDGADFTGANLEGADLTGASLKGAVFRDAVVENAVFDRADVRGADFSGAIRSPDPDALLAGPILLRRIEEAELWARSGGAQGQAAVFDGIDLRPFRQLLTGKTLPGSVFRNCQMIGCELTGATLTGAKFESCDLREASFSKADLRAASFQSCKLSHVSFTGANLSSIKARDGGRRLPRFEGNQASQIDLRAIEIDTGVELSRHFEAAFVLTD